MTTPEARITDHEYLECAEARCKPFEWCHWVSARVGTSYVCGRPRSEHVDGKKCGISGNELKDCENPAHQPAPILPTEPEHRFISNTDLPWLCEVCGVPSTDHDVAPTEPEKAEKRVGGLTREQWTDEALDDNGMAVVDPLRLDALLDAAFGPAQED